MMCVRLARFLSGGYHEFMNMPLCELEILMEAANTVAEEEREAAEKADGKDKGVKGAKIEAELQRIAQKKAAEEAEAGKSNG